VLRSAAAATGPARPAALTWPNHGAYRYLRCDRLDFLDYVIYRRRGLPIGLWHHRSRNLQDRLRFASAIGHDLVNRAGGQTISNSACRLSQVWDPGRRARLHAKPMSNCTPQLTL
jgi:hypothetical protein